MIDKKTLDKIQALEIYHFEECNRLSNERYAWNDRWEGKVGGEISVDDYLKGAEERESLPFFQMSCCAKRVIDEQHVTDEGIETMTAHWEWDPESMEIFKDGVEWAVENGLVIDL